MAFNKIWFHAGTPCNGCTGIGDMWVALEAKGIPFGVYSVNGGGLVVEATRYSMAQTIIYRDLAYDYVPYHVEPTAAKAVEYWGQMRDALPPEVQANRDRVWIEVFNEPDKERPEQVARWQYQLARAALADGYRFCGPGWAGGTPEPEAWRGEWMRKYLELCATSPNRVAVTLHEYSYDAGNIRAGSPYLVGRYNFLFDACDALGLARPTVFITETGWTLNDMPATTEAAMSDVAWLAEEYAAHPQIRAAFLWSLIGGGDKKQLAQRLNGLIRPLTEYALTARFDDRPPAPAPTPEPQPQPPPTTPPATANLLPNGDFDQGWQDSDRWPMTTQNPAGWLSLWNVTSGDDYRNEFAPEQPYLVGEAIHKGLGNIPSVEHGDFFAAGNAWTYKVFAASRPFWFRLKTSPALELPAGRYTLACQVFTDTYHWRGGKVYEEIEPHHTQTMVKANGRTVRDWTPLAAGRDHTVETTFDHAGGKLELALHLRCNWGIASNNLWLKRLALTAVAVEPPPVEPEPKPEPEPPPAPTPTPEPQPERPVLVLDLSKWNSPLDFARMRAIGVDGLIVRASYGTTQDERLDEFMARHRADPAAPPVIALYHYFHPWQGWGEQVDTLLAAMRQHGVQRGALDLEDMRFAQQAAVGPETLAAIQDAGDLPPLVQRELNRTLLRDMGINPDATAADDLYLQTAIGGLEATAAAQPKLAADAALFMAALDRSMPLAGGGRHLVYSNLAYWGGIMGNPVWGSKYDLWIAAWTTQARPAVPAPWTTWTLWQHTSSGDGPAHGVGSARVDLNRFNGDRAAFGRWLAQGAPSQPVGSLGQVLWARGMVAPSLTWNPAFALAAAILKDGYHIISDEYSVTHNGVTYRGQNAADDDGRRRVYYCVVPDWGDVKWIDGPTAAPPPPGGTAPQPAPSPAGTVVNLERAFRPIAVAEGQEAQGPFMVYQHDDGRTEDAQYLVRGKDTYLIKGGNYEHMSVSGSGIYRYEDTSHSDATYYTLRDDLGAPGSLWLPREMEIRRPFRRTPLVTFFNKSDCSPYSGPTRHLTWAVIDNHMAKATLPSGITVSNVIDLYVGSDKDARATWFERYWYALGVAGNDGRTEARGLVQWWARNEQGQIVAHSWLVEFPQGRAPLPLVRPKCLGAG